MKFIILILLLMNSFLARAIVQKKSCCVCFPDKDDYSTTKECGRWLKENKKNCDYSKMLDHFMDYKLNQAMQCEKVNVYGAYHGYSYRYIHTFNIINDVTRAFNPRELKFDASSCLIFNNVEKIEESVKRLIRDFPQVDFVISGNQNNGTVFNIPGIIKPKEMESFSSKITFKVSNRKVTTVFAACTKAGKTCDHAARDVGATNDSNSKFCKFENRVVSQSCCNPNFRGYGRWSRPGEACAN